MNKFKKIGMFLGVATLSVSAVVFVSLNEKEKTFYQAEKEYVIRFDNKSNVIPGLVKTETDATNNKLDTQTIQYQAKTKEGTNLTFLAEGAVINPDGFVTLGFNGGFSNSYIVKDEYHGRINGLKSLTVNYSGGPLTVNYGYEQGMVNEDYSVMCQAITSGVAYNFDNNYPQYFSINTMFNGLTKISDISVIYSCDQGLQNIPQTYDSGYHMGGIYQDTPFTGLAKSNLEVSQLLEEAMARHYLFADITCDYDEIEPSYSWYNGRRNFSHCLPLAYNYSQVKGAVNSFVLVYYGNTLYNNDYIFDETQDVEEHAIESQYDIASFYSHITPEYQADILKNASTEIRLNYARENNLMRAKNYNDFAVEKLDDSRLFDVYNSEDLWWAVQHDYKPRFPLTNSKAEWIYNQAKQILNSIMYEGMSNYEKVRAIYDWIITNNQYDYDALNSSRDMFENACYFLEGVFERRRGVCDSFSKTFVLLGKLEGLDVKRGLGFDAKSGGHAWGYYRNSPDENYYLICPTWGNAIYPIAERKITCLDYSAFMRPITYFTEKSEGQVNFIDLVNEDLPFSNTSYTSTFQLDDLPDKPEYDFSIDSKQEFSYVIAQAIKIAKQDFTLQVALTDENLATKNSLSEIYQAAGLNETDLKVRLLDFNEYGEFGLTLFFTKD